MITLFQASDDDLLRRIREGDERAFMVLYRRRQGMVYRFALRMTGRESLAEEVTQEAFMALIREAGKYDSARGPVASYLYGITRNIILQCLRREAGYVPLSEVDGDGEHTLAAKSTGGAIALWDPLEDLARAEAVAQVQRAVLALPAKYREVIALCELEGLDYAAAGAALGAPIGTVRSRLHRARALLLAKLRAHEARGPAPAPKLAARPCGGQA